MSCFDGLITLDKTCDASPGVLSLQTLGINETLLKDIIGAEDTTESLLAEVEQWAEAYITQDIKGRYGTKLIPHTFVDRVRLGDLVETDDVVNAAGTIGGIVVEINHPNSVLSLIINKAAYAGKTSGIETFTIYDLTTGETVTTFDINAVAGNFTGANIRIKLPSVLKRSKYFIAHPALDTYRTETGKGGCSSCSDTSYSFGGLVAYGARMGASVPKRSSNVQKVTHTSGLSLSMTLACDHGEWICGMGESAALPYLYKVGQGVMDRSLYAVDRHNNTRLDKEMLSARAAQYMEEYETAMTALIKGVFLPADPMCFSCRRNVVTVVGIP